jgi:CBS domain containing-hemolysin-like protein
MIILLLAVLLSLVISALCSLLESVLYSTRMITLEAAAGRGSSRAELMRSLKAKMERPLAALVIIDTLADIGGAALAGWAAAGLWGPASLLGVSAFFTLATLFLGDVLPKTVGAVHWRELWPWAAGTLDLMVRLMRPLIWLTQTFTNLVTRSRPSGLHVSDEEILAAARLGARAGQISQMEDNLIRNIIGLEDIRAEGIMTPRTVIVAADGALTIAEAKEQAKQWGYSRIPVFLGGPEDIIGYVLKPEALSAPAEGKGKPLASLAKRLRFVPPSANALDLLGSFLRRREHMVMVVDEYGGIMGLLTLEDVLESLVGSEIVDEKDQVADLQELARRRGRVVLAKSEGEPK